MNKSAHTTTKQQKTEISQEEAVTTALTAFTEVLLSVSKYFSEAAENMRLENEYQRRKGKGV